MNLWSWAATHRRSERLLFSRNQRTIAFRRFLNAIRAVAASSKVFSDCNVLAQRTDLATAFLKLDQWASKLSHTSGACVLHPITRRPPQAVRGLLLVWCVTAGIAPARSQRSG